MAIFVTGATGYLGGAVLRELIGRGFAVTAHARSARSVDALSNSGAEPVIGDLYDAAWLGAQLAGVEGMVHAASPGDRTSADLDKAVLDTAVTAFSGSDRPYIHTGGVWIHGGGAAITEDTAPSPPPLVAWRPAVVERVRAAAKLGVRTCVIAPANLYGHGGGLVALIAAGPTTAGDEPALVYPGHQQHFSNAHLDDIATLYRLAIESAPPGSYYVAANTDTPTMAQIAEAASRARGLGGRIAPEPEQATRDRLGLLTDSLLLDQQIDSSHARRELGWQPSGPDLLTEITDGSSGVRP